MTHQKRRLGFWRKWYLYSAPLLGLFLLGAVFLPHEEQYEESRVKCIAALIVFVPVWINGYFYLAPDLDGERRKGN